MGNLVYSNKSTKKVFVCGGGHQGLSMAAHLAHNGIDVSLWNRTYKNIESVIKTKKIKCSGIINSEVEIEKVSTNIKDVISDFIMVTTPSSAHKDIAKILAPYVHKDMIIILNPGRTYGAFEFNETLKNFGVKEMPHICETQTIIYTCRRNSENEVNIYSLKKDVMISSVKNDDMDYVMSKMPECLRNNFIPVDSVYLTSLSNVGMVLHCAPVLMNIGWIETPEYDFKYYYEGITPTIANFLEKIDKERMSVANALGYKIQSVSEWLKTSYGVKGNSLYECIKNNACYEKIDAPTSLNSRYIMEDIPNGLVPIENTAKAYSIPTPCISCILDLAGYLLGIDFRNIGRKYYKDKV